MLLDSPPHRRWFVGNGYDAADIYIRDWGGWETRYLNWSRLYGDVGFSGWVVVVAVQRTRNSAGVQWVPCKCAPRLVDDDSVAQVLDEGPPRPSRKMPREDEITAAPDGRCTRLGMRMTASTNGCGTEDGAGDAYSAPAPGPPPGQPQGTSEWR